MTEEQEEEYVGEEIESKENKDKEEEVEFMGEVTMKRKRS